METDDKFEISWFGGLACLVPYRAARVEVITSRWRYWGPLVLLILSTLIALAIAFIKI
jgi:hypothetical protein